MPQEDSMCLDSHDVRYRSYWTTIAQTKEIMAAAVKIKAK